MNQLKSEKQVKSLLSPHLNLVWDAAVDCLRNPGDDANMQAFRALCRPGEIMALMREYAEAICPPLGNRSPAGLAVDEIIASETNVEAWHPLPGAPVRFRLRSVAPPRLRLGVGSGLISADLFCLG